MTFQRVLEMTMEPPFRYYIAKDNYLSTGVDDKFCFKSLSEAKENAEKLFLQTKEKYSIYNVRYAGDDWSIRGGWVCGKIFTLDDDCNWIRLAFEDVIHVAFVWRYRIRKWDPELYDKIDRCWNDLEEHLCVTDNFDWNTIRKMLKLDSSMDSIIS